MTEHEAWKHVLATLQEEHQHLHGGLCWEVNQLMFTDRITIGQNNAMTERIDNALRTHPGAGSYFEGSYDQRQDASSEAVIALRIPIVEQFIRDTQS